MLRDAQHGFDLRDELERLVPTARNGRLHISLEVEGNSVRYSTLTLLALYRVAQEGLTNIQRHAAATRAEMRICFSHDEALLVLRDDGCGFDVAAWQHSPHTTVKACCHADDL